MTTEKKKFSTPTQKEFIEGWVKGFKEGWSLERIAAHLNMNRSTMTTRASEYRKRGVKLPKISTLRSDQWTQERVNALNTFIDQKLK